MTSTFLKPDPTVVSNKKEYVKILNNQKAFLSVIAYKPAYTYYSSIFTASVINYKTVLYNEDRSRIVFQMFFCTKCGNYKNNHTEHTSEKVFCRCKYTDDDYVDEEEDDWVPKYM